MPLSPRALENVDDIKLPKFLKESSLTPICMFVDGARSLVLDFNVPFSLET